MSEIADQAASLAWNVPGLTNMERAQILEILLSVGDLWGGLRHSRRKRVNVPVRLRYDAIGRSWIEETSTREISLRGLSVESRIPIGINEALTVERVDVSRRAKARVRWTRNRSEGTRELGLEILSVNYWGIAYVEP